MDTHSLLKAKFGDSIFEFLPRIVDLEQNDGSPNILYQNLNSDGLSNLLNLVLPNASTD